MIAIQNKQNALIPSGHEAVTLAQQEKATETRRALLDAFEKCANIKVHNFCAHV